MGPRGRRRQIGDYGFLSDCHIAALVDRSGSIDWWCPERFDSPSVFARLLDDDAGHWSIHPEDEVEATRTYVGSTLVLRTRFTTADSEVELIDALALEPGARGHDIGLRSPHSLLRRVHGRRGRVRMVMELAPRMEYGLTTPHLSEEPGGLGFRGGHSRCLSSGNVALQRDRVGSGRVQRQDLAPATSSTCTKSRVWQPSSKTRGEFPAASAERKMAVTPA